MQGGVEFAQDAEDGLVAQVFERCVNQVEVAAFQQQFVGAADGTSAAGGEGEGVGIAASFEEVFEYGLFAELCYFRSGHLVGV